MRLATPPHNPGLERRIFLAGSIEMGAAEDWQAKIIADLEDLDNLIVLNPRRHDWDSTWEQSIDNPEFFHQVTWELGMLESADVIALHFCPDTKSPISLLELGYFARSGKLIVMCPKGFWRKGNVDIVCDLNGIPCFGNYEDWLLYVRGTLVSL